LNNLFKYFGVFEIVKLNHKSFIVKDSEDNKYLVPRRLRKDVRQGCDGTVTTGDFIIGKVNIRESKFMCGIN